MCVYIYIYKNLKSLTHAEHRHSGVLFESDFKIYCNSLSFVSDSHITREELIYQDHCPFLFFLSSVCCNYSFSFSPLLFHYLFVLFFLSFPNVKKKLNSLNPNYYT